MIKSNDYVYNTFFYNTIVEYIKIFNCFYLCVGKNVSLTISPQLKEHPTLKNMPYILSNS